VVFGVSSSELGESLVAAKSAPVEDLVGKMAAAPQNVAAAQSFPTKKTDSFSKEKSLCQLRIQRNYL
jgi:hypothetical protein